MKFDLAGALSLPSLPTYLEQVQLALEQVTATKNPYIHQPVTRIVSAPSKRLRSALVIAAGQGVVSDRVMAACAAIELVHLGSLVHDDIMDNADTRWGVRTVHAKEGTNQAILVGDYLFAKANQVAASVHPEFADLIATAIINLCDGQARELAGLYDTKRTLSSYMTAIQGKTASLLSAACRAGAIANGLKKSEVEALGNFGEAFGLSFQLIDDVLDLISTPQLLGKPTASDVREGVYTMPVILALQEDQSNQLLAHLKRAQNGSHTTDMYPYLEKPLHQTLLEIKKHNQLAQASLGSGYDNLAKLPARYTAWALSNLVAKDYQSFLGDTALAG